MFVNNLTWGALGGQWTPDQLKCRKCDLKMNLYPLNKSLPPAYWKCDRVNNERQGCQRIITVDEIVDSFIEAQLKVEYDYECKIMCFAMDSKEIRVEITCDQYLGESRNVSKQLYFSKQEKDNIQDELLDYISAVLSIEIDDLSDLFQT